MSLVSFAPGFVYGCIAALSVPLHFDSSVFAALLVKNILYCLSFYFRYESLKKFGPFVGALMLGTQPAVIFLFGIVLLGEHLTLIQESSMGLVVVALLLLAGKGGRRAEAKRIYLVDFGKYYVFPTLASTLSIVWDRYFLKGHMPIEEFFILDRLVIIPAFLLTLGIIQRGDFFVGIWKDHYGSVLARNWKILSLIGLLFTLSVYTCNLALELEKAAFVGLFRNASYPIAAFAGAFFFKQNVSTKEWLSLSLVFFAIFLGVF
jgi:drug/metabolite transporter (DMT)-like permease